MLCICIASSNAQVQLAPGIKHPLTFRFSPFSLIEPEGNIMIGLGYQFNRRWAVTVDPGYILYSLAGANNNTKSISGIKIRSDIRFLFDRSRPGRFSSFIGPEFHYKYVSSKKWDDFGINCSSGQCAYYQREDYTEVKTEIGGSLKIGTLIRLREKWNLELYAGLGVKYFTFTNLDIPVGGSFSNPPQENIFYNNLHRPVQMLVPFGAKFTLQLR